ncbi:unnamed protein product [Mycena citricolor]|uniref:Uncharacterized protein n=1 Tax=Mycena citricolor TaxID=2018698 RepID=A0AAD2Q4V0_9AGAR|nr:unnamed protein product [Mycena citricolor]
MERRSEISRIMKEEDYRHIPRTQTTRLRRVRQHVSTTNEVAMALCLTLM